MDYISRKDLRELIEADEIPCISICFQTHRSGVDTLQDPIRLKNLIRDSETQLEARGAEPQDIHQLLEPLRDLVEEHEYWQHQTGGLALFRSPSVFRRFRVSFAVPELAIVADRFHLKPLLPAVEADQRVYIIGLSQDSVRVFQLTPEGQSEVVLSEMPESPFSNDAAGVQRELQSHVVAGGGSRRRFAVFHGRGSEEEDRKKILISYFRRADQAIWRRLNGEPAPIVIAGVDYLCPLYRRVHSGPLPLLGEIHGNPDSISSEELHRKGWSIASDHFKELRRASADEYHQLWHTQRASNDLSAVVSAAIQGRVKTLFVALGVQEWGRVDPHNSEVVQDEGRSIEAQDLLNLAAIQTFVSGGIVYAVPPSEVPGRGSVAAVFRY